MLKISNKYPPIYHEIRNYTISPVNHPNKTVNIISDYFAHDIVKFYFSDILGPGEYISSNSRRFYTSSMGYIYVSWILE